MLHHAFGEKMATMAPRWPWNSILQERLRRREREKRNTFKKLHFSFFPIFFLLLLINISKVVVLFYCCILFDDIGNFIDFASTRFEAKIAFFSNSIISVLRKKKENFYIIFQKKKKISKFWKIKNKMELKRKRRINSNLNGRINFLYKLVMITRVRSIECN